MSDHEVCGREIAQLKEQIRGHMKRHSQIKIEELTNEIERLKAEFQKAKQWNKLAEIQIKNLQSIIEGQNELLTRAADALVQTENYGWPATKPLSKNNGKLIQDLRDAAGSSKTKSE